MERILVVDDEIHTVRLLKDFLTSKEYEVYTAATGLEAIDKVKEVRPHIVLLDIIMPGMGGIETLSEIKSISPKIVVIMITAVIDEELAKRAMQLGADEYITKPINLCSVETTVMVKMIQLLG
ncbi:MAG: response regulator [Deltaproteobacteria bacterium]|nr:response regulator [Deltaproteobacteria bacterium]